jgi:hypothetical protein
VGQPAPRSPGHVSASRRPARRAATPESSPQALAALCGALSPVQTSLASSARGRTLDIEGRRVLCVGGMPGARQRYRAMLEAAGARFEYHDGGIEDSAARLESQLHAADLVVCHSACLNHEAYQRIKGHCHRLCKPCVYLARPSVSTFARELGLRNAGAPATAEA